MSLIHNERTKLTANALDRASTACLTVGVLGPAAAALYGLGNVTTPPANVLIIIGSGLWLVASAMLHLLARGMLGRLK